jgi:hypothetical protein
VDEAPPERPPIATAPVSAIFYVPAGFTDITAVLETWLQQFTARAVDFELLLIVSAQRQDIVREALELKKRDGRLHVIQHLGPDGVGPEIQTGLWLARFPLILTAPCDRQFQPGDLSQLFEHIDKVDVAAGYRVHGSIPIWLRGLDLLHRLLRRIVLGHFGEPRDRWLGWRDAWRRFVDRRLFGLQVKDAECPLRLYRREVFRRIPIQSRGATAHVEILAKANHLGCFIAEAPVTWTPPTPAPPADEQRRADRKALFHRPDFGPVVLPDVR